MPPRSKAQPGDMDALHHAVARAHGAGNDAHRQLPKSSLWAVDLSFRSMVMVAVLNHVMFTYLFLRREYLMPGGTQPDRPIYVESESLCSVIGCDIANFTQTVLLVSKGYMEEAFGGGGSAAAGAELETYDGTFFWYWQLAEGICHIGIVLGGLAICFLGRQTRHTGERSWGEGVYFWSMVIEVLVIDWSYCILFMHNMYLCAVDFEKCSHPQIGGTWYDGAAFGISIAALGWINNCSVCLDCMAIPIEITAVAFYRLLAAGGPVSSTKKAQ